MANDGIGLINKINAVLAYCGKTPCSDCALGNNSCVDDKYTADDYIVAYDILFGNNEKPEKKTDNVNHPQHYTHGKYECIEVMTDIFGPEAVKDFCICNAFKYLWRHKYKNGVEDIKKAKWYVDKYIELSGVSKNE